MANRRRFELTEGTSNKFWEIELEGSAFTTYWGRIGTAGQSKTKELGSADEAQMAYEKLVGKKQREGYRETSPAPSSSPAAAGAPPAPVATVASARPPTATRTKLPPPEPEAPTPPVRPADTGEPERRIALEPDDWRWATWREIPPVPTGEPEPFDREKRLAGLRWVRGWEAKWQPVDWSRSAIPWTMAEEEALFWLTSMLVTLRGQAFEDRDSTLQALTRAREPKRPFGQTLHKALEQGRGVRNVPEEIVLPLLHLLEPEELLDAMLATHQQPWGGGQLQTAANGFRRYVVPRLSRAERETWRRLLEPHVSVSQWPSNTYDTPVAFHLAASLGMHDALLPTVESLSPDTYAAEDWKDHYHQPQRVLFGLHDPALVEQHMRRLKLRLRTPDQVRGWLAHTECGALDVVAESVAAAPNKEDAEKLAKVLALALAPETAEPMLRVLTESRAPWAAKEWFEENTALALPGLLPFATHAGRLGEAALDLLRGALARGHSELLKRALESQPEGVRARVTTDVLENPALMAQPLETTPPWLDELGSRVGKKALPKWLAREDLPPILIGSGRLANDHVEVVLRVLMAGPGSELGARLREEAEPKSREAFAMALFDGWLAAGAPSKDKWAFLALGHLGGDDVALRLAPMIRAWPGESQHARAVLGLDVLRTIGSDTALMQLSGIAQKVKFRGLKQKANEAMETIARRKGLTRAELEDRVVPDCGLDEGGQLMLDFGPRRFTLVLGPEMSPMVRDAEGRVRKDLPKPASKDDAQKADAAVSTWKLVKKQLREVGKIQTDRLEQAMVTGRRWSVADFEALIVNHPLMRHLARRVLWAEHDAEGACRRAFRLTDEQDYASVEDATLELDPGSRIGLVHPLSLSEDERTRWGQLFADYEILAPFPQLGRPVYRVQADEATGKELQRFHGLKLPAPSLVFTLEKLGWARGVAMDGGCFDEHSKQFPAADVTAVVGYEGTVAMGYIDANEVLELRHAYFVRGLRQPSGYDAGQEKMLELDVVDTVVASEVIHDLILLADKARS